MTYRPYYAPLHDVLENCVNTRHGFLLPEDVAEITKHDRLRQLLVRCGGKRFVCAAQDVDSMIADVEAGGDYVRDVSLPSTDPAHRGDFSVRTFEGGVRPNVPASEPIPRLGNTPFPAHCGFREDHCSGSFDGNTVHSDADMGL